MNHQFNEIGQRYLALAMQLASAFNHEQGKMQLDQVLQQSTLASEEDSAKALQTLTRLQQLIEKHQAALRKFIPALVQELEQICGRDQLPDLLRQSGLAQIVPLLQAIFETQQAFYANRGLWCELATEICELITARRADLQFEEDGVVFVNGHDLQHFEMLWHRCEETLREEQVLLDQRSEELQQAGKLLNQSIA
jgi:predicted ArsR family transcriptional regulator